MEAPTKPGQQAATGPGTCPSCGWQNLRTASSCEFCGAPITGAPVAPRPTRPCPHCGAPMPVSEFARCPHCARAAIPTPAPKVRVRVGISAFFARLGVPPSAWIVAALVVPGFFYMLIYQRGAEKMNSANNLRELKKVIEIYEGMEGGFPSGLEVISRRFQVPPHLLTDSWGHGVRYTASEKLGTSESGEQLFARCDLRSAGPNGRFDDDDDLSWAGEAARR